MNHEWEGAIWLSVTVKEWVTQKLLWKKKKQLTHEGRMPLSDNERFQHPPAFSVHILALVSALSFFYISYMFTSAWECHGNISSECHCITSTPRKFSFTSLTVQPPDFKIYWIWLPTFNMQSKAHTQISVLATSTSLNFCI